MAWFRFSDRHGDAAGNGGNPAREREILLREIADEARMTGAMTGRPEFDARVMEAMVRVPRERFVPADKAAYAYLDQPLPIGHGQTISQPFIVALMTDLLRPAAHHIVLEVGTGCGYQAAVLSLLVRRVFTTEIIPELAATAAERLAALGYANLEARAGDGNAGWVEHAPFDGIIVTAAARAIPPALIEQLAPGGRLVAPVGGGFGQDLLVLDKGANGETVTRDLLPVAFVPLTGGR